MFSSKNLHIPHNVLSMFAVELKVFTLLLKIYFTCPPVSIVHCPARGQHYKGNPNSSLLLIALQVHGGTMLQI